MNYQYWVLVTLDEETGEALATVDSNLGLARAADLLCRTAAQLQVYRRQAEREENDEPEESA